MKTGSSEKQGMVLKLKKANKEIADKHVMKKNLITWYFLWPCIIMSITLLNVPHSAYAIEKFEYYIYKAGKKYENTRFLEMFDILDTILSHAYFSKAKKVQAYRLKALGHIDNDEEDKAKASIENILDLDPNYQVNVLKDPKIFRDLFAMVKDEFPDPVIVFNLNNKDLNGRESSGKVPIRGKKLLTEVRGIEILDPNDKNVSGPYYILNGNISEKDTKKIIDFKLLRHPGNKVVLEETVCALDWAEVSDSLYISIAGYFGYKKECMHVIENYHFSNNVKTHLFLPGGGSKLSGKSKFRSILFAVGQTAPIATAIFGKIYAQKYYDKAEKAAGEGDRLVRNVYYQTYRNYQWVFIGSAITFAVCWAWNTGDIIIAKRRRNPSDGRKQSNIQLNNDGTLSLSFPLNKRTKNGKNNRK